MTISEFVETDTTTRHESARRPPGRRKAEAASASATSLTQPLYTPQAPTAKAIQQTGFPTAKRARPGSAPAVGDGADPPVTTCQGHSTQSAVASVGRRAVHDPHAVVDGRGVTNAPPFRAGRDRAVFHLLLGDEQPSPATWRRARAPVRLQARPPLERSTRIAADGALPRDRPGCRPALRAGAPRRQKCSRMLFACSAAAGALRPTRSSTRCLAR